MERQNTPSEGMVIRNLVAVHCEGKLYIGKLVDPADVDASGCILLKDTIEFVFQRKIGGSPQEGFTVHPTIIPSWVLPANGPTDIRVRAGVYFTVADDAQIVDAYARAAGISGVLRPTVVPGLASHFLGRG